MSEVANEVELEESLGEELSQNPEDPNPEEIETTEEVDFIGFADEAPKPDESEKTNDPWKGQEAPAWVKETRNENRELKRKLRELESKSSAGETSPKLPELGTKPTLAECEYDEEALQTKLNAWYEQKSKVDAAKAAAAADEQKMQARWNEKFAAYTTAKTALARDDYEDAENAVQEALTQTQIGILVKGIKASAEFVYALGKSPAKLKSLQGLDPIETAFALARLEAQVQVNRKPKVSGESQIQGSTSRVTGGSNAELDRLYAKAEKTGDRSEIFAYKQKLKQLSK